MTHSCTVCAPRALGFAVANHAANCERLVELGGLKFLFPALMGRGLPRPTPAHKRGRDGPVVKSKDCREAEERVLAVLAQLCAHSPAAASPDYTVRLLLKFAEQEYEKLDRCVDLFDQQLQRLQQTEEEIQRTLAAFARENDLETLRSYSSEDNLRVLVRQRR